MSAYGFEIVQTLIVDIEPDEHVKRAMNEINAGNNPILHIKKLDFFFFCASNLVPVLLLCIPNK